MQAAAPDAALRQHALAFAQRLTHQADLSMFQVAQSAMNDSCGPAGGAGGKIVLLNQQRALAPLRTLARNGNTVDAAANYQNVKVLVTATGLGYSRSIFI